MIRITRYAPHFIEHSTSDFLGHMTVTFPRSFVKRILTTKHRSIERCDDHDVCLTASIKFFRNHRNGRLLLGMPASRLECDPDLLSDLIWISNDDKEAIIQEFLRYVASHVIEIPTSMENVA